MNELKDAPELEKLFQIAVEKQFDLNVDQMNYQQTQMLAVATDFYWEGVQAATAERAKFDEQNGLIVKDLGEL
jgi:hypothetical protein